MGVPDPSEKLQRFEKQVLIYVNDLYRAARRLTSQAADAEDMVQETCLRAFRALDQLKNPSSAKQWVFAILRSVFARHVAQLPHRGVLVDLDEIDLLVSTHAEFLHDACERLPPLSHALLQEARKAILRLPVPYREAIVLIHVGGFSYRETAQILGVRTGTVMSRLFRGRRMLRASLGERSTRLESA